MYRYFFSSGTLADRLAERHAQRKPVWTVTGRHQRRLEGMFTIESPDYLHSAPRSQKFRRTRHRQKCRKRPVFLDG